jgi:two-component system chemotaxis sensor kinase CheA
MTHIETLGHMMEDILLHAKDGQTTLSPDVFDLLYQSLDAVTLIMNEAEAGRATLPPKVLVLISKLEAVVETLNADETTPITAEPPADEPPADDDEDLQPDWASPSPISTEPPKATTPHNGHPEAPTINTTEAEETTLPVDDLPTPPSLNPSNPQDETIRVSVAKLDALMAQFSELLGAKIRAEQRLSEVREMQTFAAQWNKSWTGLRSRYSRLVRNSNGDYHKDINSMLDFLAHNQEELRTFNAQSNALYRQFSNDTLRLSLIINELQEEIKRVRMLPLSTITATFGRMIRDLARQQRKKIHFTIRGADTELDKRVLEQIKDPLLHLLRNAADHGIEAPAVRQKRGKSPEGSITLLAQQQGNNVVISVRDDGQGLDLNAIRAAAVRKGLVNSVDLKKLTDEETTRLIFQSGITTSKIITDISGRGVGLDVVRQNIEELHGTLEVNSKPEQGTTFIMTIPLTLASSRGLLVEAGQQTFALPLTTVERMITVSKEDIRTAEGKEMITHENRPIALSWLEDLMALPPSPRDTQGITIVIINVAEKRLGLVVNKLVGEQEIVIKSLGKQLSRVGGIAGCTVSGSGEVILVLHSGDLVKLAARAQNRRPVVPSGPKPKQQEQQKTILVVDDSITTRTLEKNILEAAGYRVKLATDGEAALATLMSEGLPNLIVSDINMPHLDGFGLTARVKQEERTNHIPIILVTSLDSPADKARGIEVGANAYIVKGSFDQTTLLETVEQLVG